MFGERERERERERQKRKKEYNNLLRVASPGGLLLALQMQISTRVD